MTHRPKNSADIAAEIRRTLETADSVPSNSSDPTQHLRLTKDNELVPPGDPLPTGPDGRPVPASVVPDGTFHRAGRR
jgi:hypothetical protein